MARDQVSLPIDGGRPAANDPSPIEATWQRWNDYGIGLLLEGATKGVQEGRAEPGRGDLHQGGGAWSCRRVGQSGPRLSAGRPHPQRACGPQKAANHKEPAVPWVINWLTGQINASNGLLDDAISSFESVLATNVPARKFDFSTDYRVINDLGAALYARAHIELPVTVPVPRDYLRKTIDAYRRTLAIDSEDVGAHWGLAQAYSDPAWGRITEDELPAETREPAGEKRRAGRPRRTCGADGLDRPTQSGRGRAPVESVAGTRDRGPWTARGRSISRDWNRSTRWSRSSAPPGTRRPTPKIYPRWRKP